MLSRFHQFAILAKWRANPVSLRVSSECFAALRIYIDRHALLLYIEGIVSVSCSCSLLYYGILESLCCPSGYIYRQFATLVGGLILAHQFFDIYIDVYPFACLLFSFPLDAVKPCRDVRLCEMFTDPSQHIRSLHSPHFFDLSLMVS